jgi:hypothetical protein
MLRTKWLLISLGTLCLVGGFFFKVSSPPDKQLKIDAEPNIDISSQSNLLNQVNVPVNLVSRSQTTNSNITLEKVDSANAQLTPHVPIPVGAISLEVMIANFEQEKKKASQAAHANPFQPLN